MPYHFIAEGRNISNPVEIAKAFCTYFTDIDSKLASEIDPPNKTYDKIVQTYADLINK